MRMRIFRHDYDRKRSSLFLALTEQVTNSRYSEGTLRNQNDVCAAGDSAVRGNPSRMTAHHFDYHHAVMGLSGGMQPVHGISDNRNRRVETKREISSADVVIDRLGNSDQVKLVIAPQFEGR